METFPETFPNIKPNEKIPEIPNDIKVKLAKRYINNFERIIGVQFNPDTKKDPIERIKNNLKNAGYL